MFKKSQFGIVFNSVFSLVFSSALTLYVQLTQHRLSFNNFMTGLVVAYAINFVLGSYIPLLKMGNAFAGIFLKDEKNPLFYLLRMLAIVVVMTAFMSFLVMFTEMGFTPVLLPAFVGSLPLTLLYAYVVAVIVFPFLLKLTMALCTKEG